MPGSISPSLVAALMGAGGQDPAVAAGGGAAPLSTMPGMFAPGAVQAQRANPSMPWYMVPGIFSGTPPAGIPGGPMPRPAPAPTAPVAAPSAGPFNTQGAAPLPLDYMGPGF